MKSSKTFARLVLSLVVCLPTLSGQDIQISGEMGEGQKTKITFRLSGKLQGGTLDLLRSTRLLSPNDLNPVRYPITRFRLSEAEIDSGFSDEYSAQNVEYYYFASLSNGNAEPEFSNVISVKRENVSLPHSLQEPVILIDKVHYILEVRERGAVVKSFPVILGRDPVLRKLHQDFRTTPEGIYRIYNLKRNSIFHRALDVDYPNRIDRIRYDFLRSQGRVPQGKSIGGEIQVHGQLRNWALERNWTWGCVALRNADIEELFDHPDIKAGTPLHIVGTDITREDIIFFNKAWPAAEIVSIQTHLQELGHEPGQADGILGSQTRRALGKFQIARGFPVTCDLDRRTVDALTENIQCRSYRF